MKTFIVQNYNGCNKFELTRISELASSNFDCRLRLRYEFFDRVIQSESTWNLELDDFIRFIEDLESMHQYLAGQATLSTFDSKCLHLEIDQMGHITVDIADGVDGYDGYIHVAFDIDQSFLPDLIKQLQEFCDRDLF